MKQIILLNGSSSSGKSSLAKALRGLIQDRNGQNYEIISIDDFMKLATDETIYEDDVFEISGDMCRAALSALKSASGVIVDHVITSERIFNQLKEMLGAYRIRTVHVHCPLSVLLQRERARGNRCLGSAEASHEYLFPKDGYDLTVNTHTGSTRECAERIFEEFCQG